jgi:hypothetical protein
MNELIAAALAAITPLGRTLTVAIARSKTPDTAHRIGAMILNLGGPASPVLSVVPAARALTGTAAARFDLIGVDTRFAGRSTPIDCHWPGSWLPRSAGVGTRQLRVAGPGRQAALAEWAAWAAARDSQYHLGATAGAVLGTVNRVYAASARQPLVVGPYRIDDTVVPAVIVNLLTDDTDNGNLASTVGELAKAAAGAPAQATDAVAEIVSSVLTGDQSAVQSPQTAVQCADAAVPRDPRWYWRDIQAHRAESPIFERCTVRSPAPA